MDLEPIVVAGGLAALLVVPLIGYVVRLRESASAALRAGEELRHSNGDLHDLLVLTAGLAEHTHDEGSLATYMQTTLERLLDADVEVTTGPEPLAGSTVLESEGRIVGSVRVEGGDIARWLRLHQAIEARLAEAFASTLLAEQRRRRDSDTIAVLSRAIEARDIYTGAHAERVARIAVGLARRLGFSGADLDAVEIGALVHNVGKIGIPGSILDKPGPLDNDEWAVMKRHPAIAELVLSELDISPIVLEIARSSHERMDGTGYPDRLAGEAIPLPARIVLVAEAFDALTTNRPYRRARRAPGAIAEIAAHRGSQFCPLVVDALERLHDEDPALLGEPVRLTVVA